MEKFTGKINVKSEREKIFSPHVESIYTFSEDDKSFRPAKGGFRTFWVKHADELSDGEKEIIEKTGIAALVLTGFRDDRC